MQITIVSWNILNDYWAQEKRTHPLQSARLDLVIKGLRDVTSKNERTIVFLCELVEENANRIASETGLVLVGSYPYRRLAELMPEEYASQHVAFFADPKTAAESSVKHIRTKSKMRDAIAMLTYKDLKIIGTHIPQRPITDFFTRREHTQTILVQNPDVVMGDFNATPLFPTRWRFTRKKYIEAHKKDRPIFPHPSFRGKNIDRFWPSMNIDVVYTKPSINLIDRGWFSGDASDHPLLWTKVEL